VAYQNDEMQYVTIHGRPGGVYHNPGREQGVAALILAFLFPILGFVLAILSINRSRNAGWPAERLAKAALWVSVLVFILGVLSWFWIGSWDLTFLRHLWWI
jgi:hypothetical protein